MTHYRTFPCQFVARQDSDTHSVYTVSMAGSGVWTLVVEASGWSRLITPSGTILDADRIDSRDDTIEAAVLAWIFDNV
jgi:hypothetical protein